MIKRDTIQRYSATVTEDEMGGNLVELHPAETIRANVSIGTNFGEITQYGVKTELILNVVSDFKLDEYLYTRYMYSGKLFRLVRQIKQGNEYYSTLTQVNGEEVSRNAND